MHTVDFFSGHESAKAAERHEPWSSDYLRQAVVDLSDPTHREQEERQEGSKEQEGVTSCSVARDNRLELLPTLAEALQHVLPRSGSLFVPGCISNLP
jgi:hypothetical protein